MRRNLLAATLLLLSILYVLPSSAQRSTPIPVGTRTVHLYTDVYKTDYAQPFRKLQVGIEADYQLIEKLSITGGLELWNQEPTPLLALGNRFYPFGATFVRYRALIGRNADVAMGIGYNLLLGKRLSLEASTDYYLDQREIGFRLGVGYLWWKPAQEK